MEITLPVSHCGYSRIGEMIPCALVIIASLIAFVVAFYFKQPYFSIPAAIGICAAVYCGYRMWISKSWQEQLDILDSTNTSLQTEVGNLTNQVQRFTNENNELRATTEKLNQVQTLLTNVKNDFSIQLVDMKRSNQQSADLTTSLNTTLIEALKLIQEIPIVALNERSRTLQAENETLTLTNQCLQDSVAGLEKQVQTLRSCILQLDTTKQDLSNEVSRLSQQINRFQVISNSGTRA